MEPEAVLISGESHHQQLQRIRQPDSGATKRQLRVEKPPILRKGKLFPSSSAFVDNFPGVGVGSGRWGLDFEFI